jgi:hypothetical protein
MLDTFRQWIGIGLLSLIVPIGIYFGRNNIRAHRGEIVRDLEKLFDFAKVVDGRRIILPSFELVKYKYDPDAAPGARDSMSPKDYLIPVLIYVTITFLGFLLVSSGLGLAAQEPNSYVHGTRVMLTGAEIQSFTGTISYAFLGGYTWTIYFLIKRVSNFDLSPLSFLRSSAHIIFGFFVSAAIWHGADALLSQDSLRALPAVALLIGMYPNLALDVIIAKYPWMKLKRIGPDTQALCEEMPLDCIIGIDAFMKFRLGDFEIEDVQNLATINPIQLFVETPYGLYEVIDWVAQAQLLLAVGSGKTLKLRNINIRTIFDFEKALYDDSLRLRVMKILLPGISEEELKEAADADGRDWTVHQQQPELAHESKGPPDTLYTLIAIINDDLHVQRLRQIWDVIAMRLNERPHDFKKPTMVRRLGFEG